MKNILLISLLFLSVLSFSQNLETKNIKVISDSILNSQVGKLKSYFEISEGSFYKYTSPNGKIKTSKFLSKNKINKNVTEIWVNYHFNYPDIENVSGALWIKLNKELKLIEDLKLDFIPQFLLNNENPNFITISQAEMIGINSFKLKGLEISNAKLEYNRKLNKYIYYITNKLTRTKNDLGNDTGEFEIVQIDAESGKVINIHKGFYGIIIR